MAKSVAKPDTKVVSSPEEKAAPIVAKAGKVPPVEEKTTPAAPAPKKAIVSET